MYLRLQKAGVFLCVCLVVVQTEVVPQEPHNDGPVTDHSQRTDSEDSHVRVPLEGQSESESQKYTKSEELHSPPRQQVGSQNERLQQEQDIPVDLQQKSHTTQEEQQQEEHHEPIRQGQELPVHLPDEKHQPQMHSQVLSEEVSPKQVEESTRSEDLSHQAESAIEPERPSESGDAQRIDQDPEVLSTDDGVGRSPSTDDQGSDLLREASGDQLKGERHPPNYGGGGGGGDVESDEGRVSNEEHTYLDIDMSEDGVTSRNSDDQSRSMLYPFEDPIDYSVLRKKAVDRIVRKKISDNEKHTYVFYNPDEFGQVKMEKYLQERDADGQVHTQYEEHYETVHELVTHRKELAEELAVMQSQFYVDHADAVEDPEQNMDKGDMGDDPTSEAAGVKEIQEPEEMSEEQRKGRYTKCRGASPSTD